MGQSFEDIAELAEGIGNCFIYEDKVNLEMIAESENISFIKGNYGNHFLGQLVHYSNKFYIILNLDQLANCESGRIRFTIAHELGHYFIDEHRVKLKNGISLSFKEDSDSYKNKKMEFAANHFAAHLLMPKNHFIEQIKDLESGISGILTPKTKYETSIESTIYHYLKLNLSTCLMIRWHSDCTFHYASCSKKFSDIIGIKKFPIPVRFDEKYINNQVEILDSADCEFIESASPISRWISTIMQGSKMDILGLEQTIKLGEFGGITMLIFHQ